MNLARAFFEGIATPTLMELWEKRQEKPDSVLDSRRRVLVGMWLDILLGLFAVRAGAATRDDPSVSIVTISLLAISFVTFGITFLIWKTSAQREFIQDCRELNNFIARYRFGSAETLRQAAHEILVSQAAWVIELENTERRGAEVHKEAQLCFSNKHAALQRFGLVEDKWDSYFVEAGSRLLEARKRASRTPPRKYGVLVSG